MSPLTGQETVGQAELIDGANTAGQGSEVLLEGCGKCSALLS